MRSPPFCSKLLREVEANTWLEVAGHLIYLPEGGDGVPDGVGGGLRLGDSALTASKLESETATGRGRGSGAARPREAAALMQQEQRLTPFGPTRWRARWTTRQRSTGDHKRSSEGQTP